MPSADRPSTDPSQERELHDRLEELGHRNAALAHAMAPDWGAAGPVDPGVAALFGLRASLAEERIELLVRWVDLLSRRLARSERQGRRVTGQLHRHEEALDLMAIALRELDDPYGLGEHLDERIAGDRERSEGFEPHGGPHDEP